jgi:hypothetical protein
LKRKTVARTVACWTSCALALVSGVVLVFLTFWLAYAMLCIGEWGVSALSELAFRRKLHLAHSWRLAISGVFILALFAEWLRRSPWSLGEYGTTKGGRLTNAVVFRTGALGGLAVLLGNPQASATMITELLYTGPRLVLGAGQLAREAVRMARMDLAGSATVFELLLARPHAVTYEELANAWQGADRQTIQMSMAWIPGVVLLEKGVSLTSDLRGELLCLSRP